MLLFGSLEALPWKGLRWSSHSVLTESLYKRSKPGPTQLSGSLFGNVMPTVLLPFLSIRRQHSWGVKEGLDRARIILFELKASSAVR